MTRFPFDHIDEIRLRLSDAADDKRMRRLATTDGNGVSILDGLIKRMESAEGRISTTLRKQSERRSDLPAIVLRRNP